MKAFKVFEPLNVSVQC